MGGTSVVNKVRSDSEGDWQKNAMGNVVSEGDVNYGAEENAFFYFSLSEDSHLIGWNNQQSLQVVVECS